jgi:hypothetical protein
MLYNIFESWGGESMHKIFGSLLMIVVIGSSFASSARGAGPSLTDTLAWMDATYNPHNANGGSYGHGLMEFYLSGKLAKRETETFSYDGCQMTLHRVQDPNSAAYSEMASSDVDSFNLGNIDPASIKMIRQASTAYGLSCDLVPDLPCDTAEIDLETYDQAPLIEESDHTIFPKLQGKDHESEFKGKTFVTLFLVDDVNYATRFVEALRHAVELCGGKPSPF